MFQLLYSGIYCSPKGNFVNVRAGIALIMKKTIMTETNLSTVSVINAVVITDCHKDWPVANRKDVIKLDPEPVTPPNI